jgi:hypothetical protein
MTELPIYVIYEYPIDYPDKYIARKFILDKPTGECFIANSLEEIREKLPKGLTCFDRDPTDDKCIVESWL